MGGDRLQGYWPELPLVRAGKGGQGEGRSDRESLEAGRKHKNREIALPFKWISKD